MYDIADQRLTAFFEKPSVALALAVERGLVLAECAMPECRCPQGRSYFEEPSKTYHRLYNPWSPSVDRFPVSALEGGRYVPENVRLAHSLCNSAAGGSTTPHTVESRAAIGRG